MKQSMILKQTVPFPNRESLNAVVVQATEARGFLMFFTFQEIR